MKEIFFMSAIATKLLEVKLNVMDDCFCLRGNIGRCDKHFVNE